MTINTLLTINCLCFFAVVMLLVAFWLFVFCVVVQCCYALIFFGRILFLKKSSKADTIPSHMVSVIICAKNEAANLQDHLPAILSQRYMNEAGKPLYEVIVVNDASTDNTKEVLEQISKLYEHLKVVHIEPDSPRTAPGKKFALSKGVEAAISDWLLFTDADCMPSSYEWLRLMVEPLYKGKEIVAGYGGFYERKGLLNMFIRMETVHTFLQYCTYTLAGMPYMAVGRNMAYTKEIYERVHKTDQWHKVPSGDDDFVVSVAGTKDNMAIVYDDDAFTYSNAESSREKWVLQKQRHVSTSKYYKGSRILLLSLYAATHAGMWLFFFFAAWYNPVYVMGMMSLRCFIFWGILVRVSEELDEGSLVAFVPLFDIGWMIYNFAFAPYIIWKNKKQWK